MFIITISVGIFLIIIGNLIYCYPTILSGYSHLSHEGTKSEHFKSFVTYIKRNCIYAGLTTSLGGIFAYLLHSDIISFLSLTLPLLYVCIEFQRKKGKKKQGIITLFILIVTVTPLFVVNDSDVSVIIRKDELQISSIIHRTIIPQKDIATIQLTYQLPQIKLRKNGYSFNNVRLGHFITVQNKNINLYTYSMTTPYIHIKLKSEEDFYINSKDSIRTIAIYENIRKAIQGN